MSKRHHYQRRVSEPHQLDVTSFLNLMVALVPFLLVTAVFSRVAILELNLPNVESEVSDEHKPIIEVIIRENELQLGDGQKILSVYKKLPLGYDLEGLSAGLVKLKEKFPQKTDVTILLERKIQYDTMVMVMDVVRGDYLENADDDDSSRRKLFPDIAIGDAP